MVRLYIRVSGRVQGVGFRWFTCAAAARLDLTGWVRNREDGDVEMEVQGDEGPVEEFIQAVSQGPRYARVDGVERYALTPEEGERSFHERGSLW
ncbi:acylphosphatase [uncultured Pseudoflavonifractor sp.]|uniref:acylphosphatase n=1 Tax=uncultured Pseudoflavonifractor sp. TaxID=1221379 RepID=UPI0025E45F29|nr:acylphosphatase [uncultured Pseudoflavonifractor sp.]